MFRRRPLRPLRPLRPVVGRAGTRPAVPPALQRAHQLMEAGDYDSAAEAFEMVARGAEARGIPRAGQLYLRAGQARILAGKVEAGMAHLKHGLSMLAATGQWQRLDQAGNRVVDELNGQGLKKEAQEISEYLKNSLAGAPAGERSSAPSKRPTLPTHCSGCGGPMRVAEADWLDDVTAECPFCGSPVRAK